MPLERWRRALSSVLVETVIIGQGTSRETSNHANNAPASPIKRVVVHVITEAGSDAAAPKAWASALEAASNLCKGCVTLETHEGDGSSDALVDFSALVDADILLVSDSGFALSAAQLSLGIVCRLGRAGFSEREVHWLPPLPLDWRQDLDPFESSPNRRAISDESKLDEARLLRSSKRRFSCRLREWLKWRLRFVQQDRWWASAAKETPDCGI
mmetsp:Transcript_29768/g.66774  ORF Transcript_29768/g.66774 Transcript_29768/m.66774 type:complete len:213 (+) Transcript_29768:569-1207(+)